MVKNKAKKKFIYIVIFNNINNTIFILYSTNLCLKIKYFAKMDQRNLNSKSGKYEFPF